MNRKDLPFFILITVAMAAWGGSWVSAKQIAGITSPATLVFWRYTLTALSFIPLLLYRKESFRLSKKALLLILGSAGAMSLYSICFFQGLKTGLPGAGGVLLTTINPLFTYLFASLLYRTTPSVTEKRGLILGFLGGIVLLRLWEFDLQQLTESGNLLFLIGAALWSFVGLFSHHAQKEVSVFQYSFYVNLLAGGVLLFFSGYDRTVAVLSFSGTFWAHLFFLSFIATTFATTSYFFAMKQLGAAKGSTFVYLVPVFAMLFSFLFTGEVPRWNTLVGGSMTLGAVWIIHSRKKSVSN